MGAESILYHARMRVLQSRKGSRRSYRQQGAGNTNTKITSPALPRLRQPVHKEKLVPPTEVLPRERSFRYAYLKHHQPSGIRRMPSLNHPPDAAKEEIIERMRAAERAKKEQEARSMAERDAAVAPATADAAVASKRGVESKKPPRMPRASGIQMNSPTSVATLPPVIGSAAPIKSQWYSEDSSSSEEEIGGSFAFLSEWSSSRAVSKRKLPSLR
mmetsp:Transcript_2060/g.5933  ORF Transcript_2060/g.5933 Transcript_2060/m.5933 type:complete len:215 (+) Transcript_2060:1128-1772(+)